MVFLSANAEKHGPLGPWCKAFFGLKDLDRAFANFFNRVLGERFRFPQGVKTEGSKQMIKNHDIFCVESLDISNLLKESPKGLSRSIADAGWRSFLHCLKYKAEEYGKHLVEAGKYFPSSQICASCGNQQKMPLFVREYNCKSCGYKSDRDYNSAIVLKAAGMSVLKPVELPSLEGA